MPISVSAKKSLRVNRRQTSTNRHRKAIIKAAIKAADAKSLPKAFSAIDKAVKWGLFHPNKAARLKSQLAKKFPDAKPVKEKTKPVEKPKKTGTVKAKAKTAAKPVVSPKKSKTATEPKAKK